MDADRMNAYACDAGRPCQRAESLECLAVVGQSDWPATANVLVQTGSYLETPADVKNLVVAVREADEKSGASRSTWAMWPTVARRPRSAETLRLVRQQGRANFLP